MYPTVTQAHDDELRRRIMNFLLARVVARVEQDQLKVTGGVVVISARLPSQHDKTVCLECCRHVAGVIRVVDRTHVPSVAKGA